MLKVSGVDFVSQICSPSDVLLCSINCRIVFLPLAKAGLTKFIAPLQPKISIF